MGDKSLGILIAIGLIFFVFVWQMNIFASQPVASSDVTIRQTAPTVNDDIDRGFLSGYQWVDQTGQDIYGLVSHNDGVANWDLLNGVGGGGSGHTIEDEGSALTARTGLNFVGAGVVCTDDAGNDETDCTISGGGSGSVVQESDSTVAAAATTFDFGIGFDLTESPANEINILLDYSEDPVDVSSSDITGTLAVANGGTGSTTAAGARTNLDVDQAGTDNSTDVTLAGTPDYITISGQVITRNLVDVSDDTNLVAGVGITLTGDSLSVDLGTSIDISSETNLVAGAGITLTGDSLSVDTVDISSGTNLVAGVGITLTGDSLSVDLGTAIDISDETNLVAGTGATLTGDSISVDLGTAIDTTEITNDTILEIDLKAVDTPVDEECLTFESTTGDFEWQTCGSGGGAIAEGRPKLSGGTVLYSIPGIVQFGVSTKANIGDTLYYFPMLVATTITLDRILIEVTGAGAGGSTARLGIYEADTDTQPGDLVLDAGTVATDSTGIKTITISQVLTAGRYVLSLIGDQNTTYRALRGSSPFHGIQTGIGTSPWPWDYKIAAQGSEHTALSDPGVKWSTAQNANAGFYHLVFVRISTP